MFRLKGFADRNELSRTGIAVKDRTQMSQTLSRTKGLDIKEAEDGLYNDFGR